MKGSSEESDRRHPIASSAYVAAVLHHVGGDVVIVHACGFRVDAREAGVLRARIVVVPRVLRRSAGALATLIRRKKTGQTI